MKQVGDYSIAAQVWALRHYGEVGPRTFHALMATFGRLEAIHDAHIDDLKAIEGLGDKRSKKIHEAAKALEESENFINSLAGRNIKFCTLFDREFPALFMELNDPPPIIFYVGDVPKPDEKTAAIVGSRKAGEIGISLAVDLAAKLAGKSISIISGLAKGIDTAGHIGALKGHGRTYAVLGAGFDNIYKSENRTLAAEMIKNGGLISEYSPDAGYSTGGLMARNRLIVGLSQAVIIGEVLPDSVGTLDTATFCHQVGKIMFIMIDGYEAPGRDNAVVEKIIGMGAIPFSLSDGIDIIAKSLV